MTLKQRNQEQIRMALGEVNRYFFYEHNGREAENEQELLEHFIMFGAHIYAVNHKQEEEK
jgi:hypothetical protein